MYFTSGLTNTANINNIISKVNYRLSVLKGIFKFSDQKTRLILMDSLVISVFRYCCPLLIDSNINLIAKLQTLLMKCTGYILGFKSYKMLTMKIMAELNMVTIHHLIIKETIQFIHKIIYNNSPSSITKLITYSMHKSQNIRSVRIPRILKLHSAEKVSQSLFYRAVYLYNELDYETRIYNPHNWQNTFKITLYIVSLTIKYRKSPNINGSLSEK